METTYETQAFAKGLAYFICKLAKKGTPFTSKTIPYTIHDFSKFLKELFDVQYPAPCKPLLALEVSKFI